MASGRHPQGRRHTPDTILALLDVESCPKMEALGRGPCLLWAGCTTPYGYGRVKFEGDTWMAHRLVYTILTGIDLLDDWRTLDHLCRNRRCCNPLHLELCSRVENVRRVRDRQLDLPETPAKPYELELLVHELAAYAGLTVVEALPQVGVVAGELGAGVPGVAGSELEVPRSPGPRELPPGPLPVGCPDDPLDAIAAVAHHHATHTVAVDADLGQDPTLVGSD